MKYTKTAEIRLGLFRCFQCRSDQQPDCGDERFDPYRCQPCKTTCIYCMYIYTHHMHWICVIYIACSGGSVPFICHQG